MWSAISREIDYERCPTLLGHPAVMMEYAPPLLIDPGFGPSMMRERVASLPAEDRERDGPIDSSS